MLFSYLCEKGRSFVQSLSLLSSYCDINNNFYLLAAAALTNGSFAMRPVLIFSMSPPCYFNNNHVLPSCLSETATLSGSSTNAFAITSTNSLFTHLRETAYFRFSCLKIFPTTSVRLSSLFLILAASSSTLNTLGFWFWIVCSISSMNFPSLGARICYNDSIEAFFCPIL